MGGYQPDFSHQSNVPPQPPGGWGQQPPEDAPQSGGWAPPTAPGQGQPPPPAGGYGTPQAGYGAPPGYGTPPPGYGGMPGYGPSGYGYQAPKASWGARLGAYLIDTLVVGLFVLPGIIAFFAGPTEIRTCSVDSTGSIDLGGEVNALCESPTGGTIAIASVLWLAGAVGGIVYFALTEGRTGQTVGKKALSIRTVDIVTGQPIGPGRAVGRFFARIISAVPCYIGYLWPLWDPQAQAFHDKIVSSVVVRA